MGMCCEVRAVTASGADARSVSLEKAWHGLHFLLTGSAWEGLWPLGFLLQGGETSGDDDNEERLLNPAAVRQVDAALSEISDEQLWSRFDPEMMEKEGVYPSIWNEPEADLRQEYLLYFQELKSLVHEAALGNMALIVMIG